MKKITTILTVAITAILFAFAPARTYTYKVDTQKSNIEWTGKKVLGAHTGDLKIASGTITVNNNIPFKGGFVINMASLSNKDITDAETKGKLLGHLKSEDFFAVEKYPAAQFVASKISPAGTGKVKIDGTLTIKGISNSISFPATYSIKGNNLIAKAENVKVDRTKYNIKYGSKSFFDSIGDKAIEDDFTLNISIFAAK